MTSVTDAACIEAKDSGRTATRAGDSIHPTSDEPPFARAEQRKADPEESVGRAPNIGDGAAASEGLAGLPGATSADDRGQGLAMFAIFTGAVLIATGAVALLALVNSWWMLGVAFAVHVAMTVIVVLTILHATAGHARATADRDRLSRPWAGSSGAPRTHTEEAREHQHVDPATEGGMALTNGHVAAQRRSPSPSSAFGEDRASVSHARRDALGPTPSSEVGPKRPRVLMVTDENLAKANEVPEPIRPLVDLAEEVYVVAPPLTTRVQSLTGDVDRAHASAEERLRTVFDHMHADGLEPRGMVGDEDQVTAIADALTGFDADLLVLRLHARGSENENWREHRLAERAQSCFALPTITFFFDDHGHAVRREEGRAMTAGRRHSSGNEKPTPSAAA
jgi:hypothetical protein